MFCAFISAGLHYWNRCFPCLNDKEPDWLISSHCSLHLWTSDPAPRTEPPHSEVARSEAFLRGGSQTAEPPLLCNYVALTLWLPSKRQPRVPVIIAWHFDGCLFHSHSPRLVFFFCCGWDFLIIRKRYPPQDEMYSPMASTMQASLVYASTGMTFWKQCRETTPCPAPQTWRMCCTLGHNVWNTARERCVKKRS